MQQYDRGSPVQWIRPSSIRTSHTRAWDLFSARMRDAYLRTSVDLKNIDKMDLGFCIAVSVLIMIAFISFAVAEMAPCYWPGGVRVDSHTPCNESAEHSHCCVQYDACLSNGYCFQAGDADMWGNRIARTSCTDPTFQAPECAYYCGDSESNYSRKWKIC